MDRATIQEKLEAYRRRKRKEEMIESIRRTIQNVLPWNGNETVVESLVLVSPVSEKDDKEDIESTCSDDSVPETRSTVLKTIIYLLYFLLWATLYIIAIKFEFGAIYFILSTLICIWLNTHTRPKRAGEPSAYSVFNPNCEAIEGTFDASQIERQIRYGIGSVR
ncbi:SAYSVFN motif domain containing 1 [Calliopsis andreniformis]|uniref:SAYSVFN motif domain containing 1 n=1 Tax=Calliopsis andreniformis TaxID=337506 RepID=UPI003FCEAAAA